MIGNCYKQLRPEEYYEIGAEDEVVVDDVVLEVPEEEVHVVTKNLELDLDFVKIFGTVLTMIHKIFSVILEKMHSPIEIIIAEEAVVAPHQVQA